jgi:hypothetical protein
MTSNFLKSELKKFSPDERSYSSMLNILECHGGTASKLVNELLKTNFKNDIKGMNIEVFQELNHLYYVQEFNYVQKKIIL